MTTKNINYEPVLNWAKLPMGISFYGDCAAVATDSKDNVYVFNRGTDPVCVFDESGNFIRSFGKGDFDGAHGIAIDEDDNIYLVDTGGHFVQKRDNDGKVIFTIGERGKSAEWQSGKFFNRPTDVAIDEESGNIFVSDGYGNSRVVKYSKEGEYLHSWGKKGKAPGEFNAPHTIAVDHEGKVYVGDRENHRIQIFDENGKFLKEWTHLGSPWGLYFSSDQHLFMCDGYKNRILKLDLQGRILGTLGKAGKQPGNLYFSHHLAISKTAVSYTHLTLPTNREV